MPLLWPAIASGWLFIFLIAATEMLLPLLLAGPNSQTVAVAMFDLWSNGQGGEVSALGLLWAALMTVFASFLYFILRRQSAATFGEYAMLSVENLSKVYASTDGPSGGVRGASFTLEPGTFFTLLGPSGCGKTTTLRCVAGLEQPDEGVIRVGPEVFFDGSKRINVPMNRRQVGWSSSHTRSGRT